MGSSRFVNFGRLMLVTSGVSIASLAAAPQAMAAGADGTYEFKKASGSVKFDGNNIDVSQKLVKRLAGFVGGEITIKNNTLRLKKNATGTVVENLGDDLNIDVEASVSGPTSLVLAKKGSIYTGKTTSPLVAEFEAEVFGEDFSGELRSRASATVDGKTLTVVIRFSGETLDEDFSGKLTIVGKR